MYKKIIIGIDESDITQKALEKGVEFKKQFNSDLVIFHSLNKKLLSPTVPIIIPYPLKEGVKVSYDKYKKINDSIEQQGEMVLNHARAFLNEEELDAELRLIHGIEPKDYYINAINDEKFDLAIIGYKGDDSELKKFLFSSKKKGLINGAQCDILIVK